MRLIQGDALEVLKTLPDCSVHCCVTSPPYWGLRDYGVEGQIGLEPTLDEFIGKLVAVFREVRRVLRDDGTCWVNMGDGYASQTIGTIKSKDMLGQPWALAFALRADGWWLRQDIIWHKPNPMPESTRDRCTKAHEYIFLLTKSARYYYDAEAIAEVAATAGRHHKGGPASLRGQGANKKGTKDPANREGREMAEIGRGETRNKRSVWTVTTKGYPEAHFATFPPKLIEPCILAGTGGMGCCPECGAAWRRVVERESMEIDRSTRTHSKGRTRASGTMTKPATSKTVGWESACECDHEDRVPCMVLDPFNGSGTTGQVALEHGCDYIGIELNSEYLGLTCKRLKPLLDQRRMF